MRVGVGASEVMSRVQRGGGLRTDSILDGVLPLGGPLLSYSRLMLRLRHEA